VHTNPGEKSGFECPRGTLGSFHQRRMLIEADPDWRELITARRVRFRGALSSRKKLSRRPKENISGARHPNLAAAQRISQQASEKIVEAQEANEWDLQGHAQQAKNLVDEVKTEMKQAAEMANRK
jgi:hypothetical protein